MSTPALAQVLLSRACPSQWVTARPSVFPGRGLWRHPDPFPPRASLTLPVRCKIRSEFHHFHHFLPNSLGQVCHRFGSGSLETLRTGFARRSRDPSSACRPAGAEAGPATPRSARARRPRSPARAVCASSSRFRRGRALEQRSLAKPGVPSYGIL